MNTAERLEDMLSHVDKEILAEMTDLCDALHLKYDEEKNHESDTRTLNA